MKISYLNEKIIKCCFEHKAAIKLLGPDSARKLRTRLSDLSAASNVFELVAGKRILFVPSDDPPPRKADGGIDWLMVEDITIVFIGDNYD